MSQDSLLVCEKTASTYLNLSVKTLQKFRQDGRGPRFVRISRRCVRYRTADLASWAESKLVTSTSSVLGEVTNEI